MYVNMYDIFKPKNISSILPTTYLCGGVDSKEPKNLTTALSTVNVENKKIKNNIGSK